MTDVTTDNGGLRYNEGKPRMDLLPPDALLALADHYRRGAAKYKDRNWERGMDWGKCFASMERHAWAWAGGEDFDEETGSHHMTAVAWNAFALYSYFARGIGVDDRAILTKNEDSQTSVDEDDTVAVTIHNEESDVTVVSESYPEMVEPKVIRYALNGSWWRKVIVHQDDLYLTLDQILGHNMTREHISSIRDRVKVVYQYNNGVVGVYRGSDDFLLLLVDGMQIEYTVELHRG